jgi:mannose-6-phosphate isomerase
LKTLLRCRPRYVEKVWGGRRLETVLGRELPPGRPIGESWEVSFRPDGPTPVVGGLFDGRPRDELAREHPEELLGPHVTARFGAEGPLLLKIIDASRDLSVQVHPDEVYEAAHPDAEAKSEAWYVLAADEGSRLIRGVDGVDAAGFRGLLEAGRLEECLHEVRVSPGDVMDLPARTLHALGAGVMIAEIQQSSDTTYRVYDWNRVGLDGRPRELHVERALEVTDFSPPSGDLARAEAVDSPPGALVMR